MLLLDVLAAGSRPTTSADLSWLWAALIGVGGAVVGGIVGGWYVMRTNRQQSQRDREDVRTDRSRQAALAIASAIGELITAMVAWRIDCDDQKLGASLVPFNLTAGIQNLALADDEVRARVVNDVYLAASIPSLPDDSESAKVIADAICRHSQEVIDALGKHVHGRQLPPYEAPPLNDAEALMSWMRTKAELGKVAIGAPQWFARRAGTPKPSPDR
jgi:hypothetical protein